MKKPSPLIKIIGALAVFATTGALPAQSFTWNQLGGGTHSWQVNANWNPNTGFPNSNNASANLNVDIAAATSITLAAPVALDILIIGDSGGSLFGYTIGANGGSAITFGNTTTLVNSLLNKKSNTTDIIAAPFTVVGNVNANIEAGTLDLSGDVNINGNNTLFTGTDPVETLTKNGNGILRLSGNTTLTAASAILVQAGTMNLDGAINKLTGKMQVVAGTLQLRGAYSILDAASGNNLQVTGGTLNIGAASGTSRTAIAGMIQQTGGTINIGVTGGVGHAAFYANNLDKQNGTLRLQNGTGGGTTTVLGGVSITKSGANVSTVSGVISLSNTTGLTEGMRVFGPGIPDGAYITAISPGVSITINATPATPATNVPLMFAEGVQNRTGSTIAGSATISVANTQGFAVGQTVTGAGVPVGARITAIGVGTITLDTQAIGSGAATLASYSAATLTLSGLSSTTEVLSGPGTATGLVNFDPSINLVMNDRAVLNFTDSTATIQNFTFSSINSSNGSTVLAPNNVNLVTQDGSPYVFVTSTTGIAIGTTVTGVGIPADARVIAIVNNYLVLDKNATATSTSTVLTVNTFTTLRSQAGDGTITVGNYSGVDDRFDGRIDLSSSGGNSRIIKEGSNTFYIGGYEDNSSGRVEVRGGTVVFDKHSNPGVHAVGSTVIIGDADVAIETLKIAGTHDYAYSPIMGAGMTPFNNFRDQIYRNVDVTINATGVLDLNGNSEGFNQINGTGGIVTNSNAASASTLILGENNSGATISATLQDGAGVLALIKSGLGTMTFANDNTYTGSTLIARGTVQLNGATGAFSGTTMTRISNATLLLDNTTNNVTDAVAGQGRLNNTGDIIISNGTLTIRNSNTAAVNTLETVGDFTADVGHTILRIDHATNVDNTVRLHMASYTRLAGSQISIVENTGNQGGLGSGLTPNTARSQFTVGAIPTSFLIGANGAVGTASVSILQGAFGGATSNNTNEFMTVHTISGINYIRPLTSAEYVGITAGGKTSQVGVLSNAGVFNIGSDTAYNSAKIGVSSGTVGLTIKIAEGKVLKLGDGLSSIGYDPGGGYVGAGMMVIANNAISIDGGYLDFGTREAIMRVNANALIQSTITGTGGLYKGGGSQLDLLGANQYSGQTVVGQGGLRVFRAGALGLGGAGNGTRLLGSGFNGDTLMLGNGVSIGDPNDPTKQELLVMEGDSRLGALNQNNVWNGNVIIDSTTESGQNLNVYMRIRADTGILTINGDVTGGENPVNPSYNGAGGRYLYFAADNLREGIVNINGSISDQNYGSAVNGDHEKLNITVRGSTIAGAPANEFHVNINDASKLHGQLDIQNGFVRLNGNYGTDPTVGNTLGMVMRIRNQDADSPNQIAALLMTQAGSIYNVSNITWTDNNNGYSASSYGMLGAEINSGVVTIGNGTGSLDMNPTADSVASQSFTSSGTATTGTNRIDLSGFQSGFSAANLRAGMQLTGTGISNSTYILQIIGNQIVLNTTVTNTSFSDLTFNDAVPASAATQRYADARLYSMEGGELDLRMRLLDDGGFSLENEVGAVTKVGRGNVRLSGSTNLSGELDGGMNLHGGTLILDYTQNYGRKVTSGDNQQAPLTLAGGDLFLRGAAGNDATTTADDLSIEQMRGILIMRAGDSLIRVQSGGVGNTTRLDLGPPSNLFLGNGMLPVRYAGATMAFWRDTTQGGDSIITLELPDIYTGAVALPWAVYADETTGKITDFARGGASDSQTGLIFVEGAADGGNFYFENNADFFVDGIEKHGYHGEAVAFNAQEGSGFFGTINAHSEGVRLLLFNQDNDNQSGLDYVGNGGSRADRNNVLKIGAGTLVLESAGWENEPRFLGGAILISNDVGNTNKMITGGAISSALETAYFDPDITKALVKSYDLIVHNYAEVPDFVNQAAGGGIFTIESNIVNLPDDVTTAGVDESTFAVNFVHSGTGWTKMARASDNDGITNTLGVGYGYTGSTFFNGGTVWVSNPNKLGATPLAFDSDNLYFTGGRLRIADMTDFDGVLVDAVNSSIVLDANRGITIGGDGAFIDVVSANTTFTINSLISVEVHAPTFAGGIVRTSNLGVGDLTKEGLGRMVLTHQQSTYSGITEIEAGTLQVNINTNPLAITQGASSENTDKQNKGALGSSYSFIDGTFVKSNARLDFQITGGAANGTAEWITLDGGTLGTTASHVDGALQGVIRIREDSIIDIVNNTILRFNSDAGYMTGSGSLTKTGAGTLHLFENNDFTGNWHVAAGRVEGISQGTPFGTGSAMQLGDTSSLAPVAKAEVLLSSRTLQTVTFTASVTSGQNLVTVTQGDISNIYVGMPVTGPGIQPNSVVIEVIGSTASGPQFRISNNASSTTSGAMTATLHVPLNSEYTINQNIVVNAEAIGASNQQVKRIGAINHDALQNSGQNGDRYVYNGTITLNDDLVVAYEDSSTNTGITSTGRDMYVALNNELTGSGMLRTEVVLNGDTTGINSNDLRITFELNGDNGNGGTKTAWTGDLVMGNSVLDRDKTHTVRLGHNNALTAANEVFMNYNNVLQVGGKTVTIGNLTITPTDIGSGAGAILNPSIGSGVVIENAASTAGKISIVQTVDENWDVIFQNGTAPAVYQAVGGTSQTLSVAKLGTGIATLTQNNAHTGTTEVGSANGAAGGTLRHGVSGALSASTAITVFGGTLDLNGFNQTTNAAVTLGGGASGTTANISTGAGTFTLGSSNAQVTYDSTNNANGATISGNLAQGSVARTYTVGDSSAAQVDLMISAVISGTNTLTKAGLGTMALAANNTYTGSTFVDQGNLQVGVSGVGRTSVNSGTGVTTVAAGATISGTGTISGTASSTTHVVNGMVSAGDNGGASTGTLTFSGHVTASTSTSHLYFQLASTTSVYGTPTELQTPGSTAYNAAITSISSSMGSANATGYDQVDVQGTLTLGADTRITVVYAPGTTDFEVGSVFNLMDWVGIVQGGNSNGASGDGTRLGGLLGDLDLPTLGAGKLWDVSKLYDTGIIVVVGVIPEPNRAVLLVFAMSAVLLRRRRHA